MSASSKNSKGTNGNNSNQSQEKDVDVLYQKLGSQWFAFSIIDEEVFVSPVSEDKINEIKNEAA